MKLEAVGLDDLYELAKDHPLRGTGSLISGEAAIIWPAMQDRSDKPAPRVLNADRQWRAAV
jgi:hypothetical protein